MHVHLQFHRRKKLTSSGMVKLEQASNKLLKFPFLPFSYHSANSTEKVTSTHIFGDGEVGAGLLHSGAAVLQLLVPFLVLGHSPGRQDVEYL